jgi:hypothetical protein
MTNQITNIVLNLLPVMFITIDVIGTTYYMIK